MANYLTIDIGNSSAKAALWIDGELAERPIWGDLSGSDIASLCARAQGPVDAGAICSVAVDGWGLADAASRLCRSLIVADAECPLPLSLGRYATLGTLGADRIAALAGAQSLYPGRELLVVDCGTAITYDRLSSTGEFLGGNISPGLGVRLRALHAFTARLPEVETDPSAPTWGLSTAQAMQAGAICGAVGEIEYYQRQCPAGTAVVVTGGRAPDLYPRLSIPATVDTDLVLRGLKHIIEYNLTLK